MQAFDRTFANNELRKVPTDRTLGPAEVRRAAPGRSPTTVAAKPSQQPGISVQITDPEGFEAITRQWRDLVARAAEPNAFQEPAFVRAAHAHFGGAVQVLLVWQDGLPEPARLIGAWTLKVSMPRSRLPVRVLKAPLVPDYAFLSTPVIDRDLAAVVLTAMLDAIVATSALPKILLIQNIGADGPVMAALEQVLLARRAPSTILDRRQRAKLFSPHAGPTYIERSLSSSSRKKLRQHRRRLAQQGPVETISCRGPIEGVKAFEQFLELEAASWKGKAGTAILCSKADAAFARDVFRRMAVEDCAWVEALRAGDRAISTQVMMRSGRAAFTWKIAHDESFGEFSPGILLVEDYTTKLLADPGVEYADSCSFSDQGFMADLWKERRKVVDLCFDATPGGSVAFQTISGSERLYSSARRHAKNLKLAWEKKRLSFALGPRRPKP